MLQYVVWYCFRKWFSCFVSAQPQGTEYERKSKNKLAIGHVTKSMETPIDPDIIAFGGEYVSAPKSKWDLNEACKCEHIYIIFSTILKEKFHNVRNKWVTHVLFVCH